ncbi:MAG: TonB family protein [Deltaproteobacteria bacterium]|nr:TonB family protein [Deltaproteobacteria bacterium]
MSPALAVALALLGQAAGASDPNAASEPALAAPGLIKLPELIEHVDADYPEDARARGVEGVVLLVLDVDAAGHVTRVEVKESAGHGFDHAAVEAAARFVYSPAEAEGIGPVPVRISYSYAFVLRPARTATVTETPAELRSELRSEPVLPINLSGTIREGGSRSPVGFATIRSTFTSSAGELVETSTESDERGKFAFRGLLPGAHAISVVAPLFDELVVNESIREAEAAEVLYFLTRSERDPYEVVVRATAPRKEVARRTIKMEEIQRIPGTQGDAVRVVQNLPGVARSPFGIGLLVVRGAPPQSTGVFLDGQRIPIFFHFGGIGGLNAVVQSRILDQIDFYPGGFSPEYGRLSGGVIDLETRAPKGDRVHGEALLDFVTVVPVTASIFVEGPVSDDPDDGAFLFALRRSSIDGVFAIITELFDSSVALAPRFYDYQFRWDKPLGDKSRTFTFFAFGSDDELVLTGGDDLAPNASLGATRSRTFFHRINPRFTYRPDADTELLISPILGADFTDTKTSEGGADGSGFSAKATAWNGGLVVKGRRRLSESVSLSLGGDLLYYRFDNESKLPGFAPIRAFPSPVQTDQPTREDKVSVPAWISSIHGEAELSLFEDLTLWPGVRVDVYDFSAAPGPLVDPRLVEGRTLLGVDPRLTARYQLFSAFALKAQAGIFSEPPLPPFFFINADLPLQWAEQYSAGFDWDIFRELNLDIQVFHRFAHRVPRPSGDTQVVNGVVRPVGFAPNGQQRAFGLELLLKLEKKWGLYGWVAYTLSRSEFRREDEDWLLNFAFDQTHNLNVLGVYELGLNWSLGVRFRFVTGGAQATTLARWYDADSDQYQRTFGEQNRTPAFHQLDVYLEKRWAFDDWYLDAYLDVQNLYNHTNTELYAPTFDLKNTVGIPGLPIFPAIGLKGVF